MADFFLQKNVKQIQKAAEMVSVTS